MPSLAAVRVREVSVFKDVFFSLILNDFRLFVRFVLARALHFKRAHAFRSVACLSSAYHFTMACVYFFQSESVVEAVVKTGWFGLNTVVFEFLPVVCC